MAVTNEPRSDLPDSLFWYSLGLVSKESRTLASRMIRMLWLKGKQAGWRSGLQRNHAALAVASGQAGES